MDIKRNQMDIHPKTTNTNFIHIKTNKDIIERITTRKPRPPSSKFATPTIRNKTLARISKHRKKSFSG